MADRRFAVDDPPSPDYRLTDTEENVHYTWNNALEPARTVEPGAVIEFDCRDAFNRQLPPDGTVEDLYAVEPDGHPLTGPVAVEGAEPGDTLRVDVLAFEHEGWGVTTVPPGSGGGGLLPEEFPDAHVRGWDLDGEHPEGENRVARFIDDDAPDVAIPLHPFPGNLGVAPGEDGEHDTMPPRAVGGGCAGGEPDASTPAGSRPDPTESATATVEPLPEVTTPKGACDVASLPDASYPGLPSPVTPSAATEFARTFEREYGAATIDGSVDGTDGMRTTVERETESGVLLWVLVRFDYTTQSGTQTLYGSTNSDGWYYVTDAFAVRAPGSEGRVPKSGWRTVACR